MANLILQTDSYIPTHHSQYPPGTDYAYSYVEARGGDPRFKEVVFFGLQYYMKNYLAGVRITQENVDEARAFFRAHFGRDDAFDWQMWQHIATHHSGRLPIRIKAVPEGTVVPIGNVLFSVESTDPRCATLAGHVETLLLKVWHPSTCATNSRLHKKLLTDAHEVSGTTDGLPAWIAFALHDFGYRGAMGEEAAALGGAGHLLNFGGTDTLAAIVMLRDYYDGGMAGFSIPAMAHCTVTSWRSPNGDKNEEAAFRNMLTKAYPFGLAAVVADSWNIYYAVSDVIGHSMVREIKERDGRVVVRPDSGDPKIMVVEVAERLWEAFGGTTNDKGFRVLHPNVRVIHGDGISLDSLPEIIASIHKAGFSIENFAFGEGAGLHVHNMSRDTCGFAFKLSAISVNGELRPVFKNPIHSKKRSKAGRLTLVRFQKHDHVTYQTFNERELAEKFPVDGQPADELRVVFENGRIVEEWTLQQIRERAAL